MRGEGVVRAGGLAVLFVLCVRSCSLILIRPFLFFVSSLVLDGALWVCPLFFSIAAVAPCFLFVFLNLYAFIILTLLFVFGLLFIMCTCVMCACSLFLFSLFKIVLVFV